MDILHKTEIFVKQLLTDKLPANRKFHNLKHTENVVKATEFLCSKLNLTNLERELVLLAAWFHDVGHVITFHGHEIESQQIASLFLKKNNYSEKKIEAILAIIGATHMPQSPTNLLERIICDADLFHLSSSDYCLRHRKLKEELILVSGMYCSSKEWEEMNVQFLKEHEYFTDYGRTVLSKKKETNLKRCEKQLE